MVNSSKRAPMVAFAIAAMRRTNMDPEPGQHPTANKGAD
jgi:hypothetical protein